MLSASPLLATFLALLGCCVAAKGACSDYSTDVLLLEQPRQGLQQVTDSLTQDLYLIESNLSRIYSDVSLGLATYRDRAEQGEPEFHGDCLNVTARLGASAEELLVAVAELRPLDEVGDDGVHVPTDVLGGIARAAVSGLRVGWQSIVHKTRFCKLVVIVSNRPFQYFGDGTRLAEEELPLVKLFDATAEGSLSRESVADLLVKSQANVLFVTVKNDQTVHNLAEELALAYAEEEIRGSLSIFNGARTTATLWQVSNAALMRSVVDSTVSDLCEPVSTHDVEIMLAVDVGHQGGALLNIVEETTWKQDYVLGLATFFSTDSPGARWTLERGLFEGTVRFNEWLLRLLKNREFDSDGGSRVNSLDALAKALLDPRASWERQYLNKISAHERMRLIVVFVDSGYHTISEDAGGTSRSDVTEGTLDVCDLTTYPETTFVRQLLAERRVSLLVIGPEEFADTYNELLSELTGASDIGHDTWGSFGAWQRPEGIGKMIVDKVQSFCNELSPLTQQTTTEVEATRTTGAKSTVLEETTTTSTTTTTTTTEAPCSTTTTITMTTTTMTTAPTTTEPTTSTAVAAATTTQSFLTVSPTHPASKPPTDAKTLGNRPAAWVPITGASVGVAAAGAVGALAYYFGRLRRSNHSSEGPDFVVLSRLTVDSADFRV